MPSDPLDSLRQVAEAATPGPWDWMADGSFSREDGAGILASCLYKDTKDSDETVLDAGNRWPAEGSFEDDGSPEPVIVVLKSNASYITPNR